MHAAKDYSLLTQVPAEKFLFILRQEGSLPCSEIVMNNHGRAFNTQAVFLPGFMADGKRLVSDMAYPGTNFNFRPEKKLIDKIIIRMGHNEGPIFIEPEIRGKNSENGIPGGFKPKGQYGVIDMSETVYVAEPWLYDHTVHGVSSK